MIKEIDLKRLNELCEPHFSKKPNILLARLCSNALCFEQKGLARIYEIQNKENPCGVICRYGGGLTLYLFKNPDFSELCAFLSALGVTTIECETRAAKKISKKLSLRKFYGELFFITKPPKYEASVLETENVSDFFDVLKAADPFYKNTSYEEYYCDVFYRSALPARLFLAEHSGSYAATAAVMHRYKNISIISDVSVLPDLRRRGIATALVSQLCKTLISEGQTPTLLCTSQAAKKVYKKIGFRRCGRFCLLSFSQNTKDDLK